MTNSDQHLPQDISSSWDLLGLGDIARQLVGPITRGVGKLFAPSQRRREDRAERENFDDWDEALKRKGYQARSVELTLGQRTEVRVLAEQIGQQRNRENIAWETIEHARTDNLPADPSLPEPSDDWLDRFWRLAQNVTDSDMQAFWGLILSRRATRRAAFSARALEFLATLTGDEARDLERLAKCALTTMVDGQLDTGLMHSINTYQQPLSEAQKVQLESLSLKLMQLLNPIRGDLFGPLGIYVQKGFAHTFHVRPDDGIATLSVADQSFKFTVESSFLDKHGFFGIGVGTAVSPLAKEIFGMLKSQANEDYVAILKRSFEIKGIALECISQLEPGVKDELASDISSYRGW